jgi:hypothetical protein
MVFKALKALRAKKDSPFRLDGAFFYFTSTQKSHSPGLKSKIEKKCRF